MNRVLEFLRKPLERSHMPMPAKYVLAREEFETEPIGMTQYKPFELVTRYNFTSWLASSFIESRGSGELQATFFRLTRLNTGLDVLKTLRNFGWEQNGKLNAWMRLSRVEQDYLTNHYNKLVYKPIHTVPLAAEPIHHGNFVHPPYSLAETFNTQIRTVYYTVMLFPFNPVRIYRGMSMEEFRKRREPKLHLYRKKS